MHAYTFPHKNEWSPYWPVEVRQDQRWMFLMTGRITCTLIGGQNWWQLSHILFNISYIPTCLRVRINGSLHIFCLSFLPIPPLTATPQTKKSTTTVHNMLSRYPLPLVFILLCENSSAWQTPAKTHRCIQLHLFLALSLPYCQIYTDIVWQAAKYMFLWIC